MGTAIVIANQKGGVGKTTTAMNLSACLAMSGKRTLLLDLDPQGNASSGLGLKPAPDQPTIYNFLLGEATLEEVLREGPLELLEVVPANLSLIGAEIELVASDARERRLLEALGDVRSRYDFIIIDCPPSLGLLTLNAMTFADAVIVPLQCEYYALEGVLYLMQTIERIRESFNPDLGLAGVLLTMYDPRTNISHQVAEEVRSHFGEKVFKTVIPRNVRLAEAPSHALPIVLYARQSRGAEAYLSLAEELIAHES